MLELKRIYEKDPVMPVLRARRSELQKGIEAMTGLLPTVAPELTALLEAEIKKAAEEIRNIRAEQEKRFVGVEVLRVGGKGGLQHISPNIIEGGVSEGWLSMGDGRITIHAESGDVALKIVQRPGRYCCHCEEKLDDDARGEAARAHVMTHHAGTESPDKQNPAGYCCINAYVCAKEE